MISNTAVFTPVILLTTLVIGTRDISKASFVEFSEYTLSYRGPW
jgi:hypothetical protein